MKAANIITLSRIALIPVFMIVFLSGAPNSEYAALVLFLLASATDGVDGYVARKYDQVSTFGKFIDPLADKLLITAALVMLVEVGRAPSWMVVLVLARELIVTSLRMVASAEGRVIAATNVGKVKMVVQVVCVSVLLTKLHAIPIVYGFLTVGELLLWLMTVVTAWSGIEYCYVNRDILRSR